MLKYLDSLFYYDSAMQLNQLDPNRFSIQSSSQQEIKIQGEVYQQSLYVNAQRIVPDWRVKSLITLTMDDIAPLLESNPALIIIGHSEAINAAPIEVLEFLSKQRIGIECMSIAAACRTFNLLLGEQREVVLGLIL